MNIQKVGTDKFYFDVALRQSRKPIKMPRFLKGLKRTKYSEIERIRAFTNNLNGNLTTIERTFPSLQDLDNFYVDLIDNNIGADKLKKTISKIKGTIKLIRSLEGQQIKKIRSAGTKEKVQMAEKSFFGRVSSALKKVHKDLEFLENSRKEFRKFPKIKTGMKTVCIAGYPNVGKSTLLRKLTTAKPEVNIYPFTTKGLMMGYIDHEIQIIDTPGTFRDKKTMNSIEMQAYLALKHLADSIIIVIDYTESCGYSVKLQEELIDRIKKEFKKKKILRYASKQDLMTKEDLKKYSDKNTIFDAKTLKEKLLKK